MENIHSSDDHSARSVSADRKPYHDHQSISETLHGRPATSKEVAYRNGYTEAQLREQLNAPGSHTSQQHQNGQQDQSESASTEVLVGLLLASLMGVIVGAFYWISQTDEPSVPVVTPQPTSSEPKVESGEAIPTTNHQNSSVVERTIERVQDLIPEDRPDVLITFPDTQDEAASQSEIPTAEADLEESLSTEQEEARSEQSASTP